MSKDKMERKIVGLALGSGAARGLAHIGVLEVLEREGIPIDMIAGTSAGAVVGAMYAQGKDTNLIKKLALDLGWKRLAPLADLALPKTGFIEGKKIKEQLKLIIGDVKFSDLNIPFACVATDVMTGEEVIINQGSVLEGVRASISIPVIFTVANWKGKYLVDGGLVNPVPVSVLKNMGADFIIAVNVIPNFKMRINQKEKLKEPNLFNVLIQCIYIGAYLLVRTSLKEADIAIEPQLVHVGASEFRKAEECISQGRKAAEQAIPQIKKQLALNV